MDFTLNVPFTKVDKARRLVTGIATADCVDKEDDIIDFAGSVDAFNSWPGNVREMHLPKAVGKMVDFKPVATRGDDGQIYNGMEATIYVSKGAKDTWEKVLDGTLTGFSVGGDIIESSYEFNKSTNKSYRRVKKYAMHELSLVDNPANPMSRFTMIKSVGDGANEHLELQGGNDFTDVKPLFYCSDHGLAKVGEAECEGHQMSQIGFVEDFDSVEIRKMIESYENIKNGGEKDELVLHKNANTDNVNNMEELNDVQKESIVKRFTSVLFGNESEVAPTGEATNANPLEGVFSPVFNITVPSAPEAPAVVAVVEEAKEEEKVEEPVLSAEEVSTDEGGDNVDTNEVVEQLKTALTEQVGEISKSLDAKFEALEKSVDEKVDSVKVEVDTAKSELEKFANDGAISKSVETDSEVDEQVTNDDDSNAVQSESFWKGAFVDSEIVNALGYTS